MKRRPKKIVWSNLRILTTLLLLCALLLTMTGCRSTEESIAPDSRFTVNVNFSDVWVPEITGTYKHEAYYNAFDLNELIRLTVGERDVIREDNVFESKYTAGSGALILTCDREKGEMVDGKYIGDPWDYTRIIQYWDEEWAYNGGEAMPLLNIDGFSPEHGRFAEHLSESGADDPKMAEAKATAQKIMDCMNYDDSKLVFAGKFTKEKLTELYDLMYYGQYEAPDSEWYYIRYHIIPDSLPEELYTDDPQSGFITAMFLFDETGLRLMELPPMQKLQATETGVPCSPEEAYEGALVGFKWEEGTLCGMEYILKGSDRLYGVWAVHFLRDVTDTLTEEELTAIEKAGGKGRYEERILYVNAMDGKRLTGTSWNYFNNGRIRPIIHKYNTPELFQ